MLETLDKLCAIFVRITVLQVGKMGIKKNLERAHEIKRTKEGVRWKERVCLSEAEEGRDYWVV